MALNCEILPCPDALPQQLKRLGAALCGWFSAYIDDMIEAGHDVDAWMDMNAIDDLLAGEQPHPFALRCAVPGITTRELSEVLAAAESRHTLLRRLLPTLESRAVLFGLSFGEEYTDELVAAMRRHLPIELVAGIRVNGCDYRLTN